MPERFVIWGAGGHGKVIRDLVLRCGDEVVGFIDRRGPAEFVAADGTRLPIGSESDMTRPDLPWGGTAVALAIGDNAARLAAFEVVRGRFSTPPRVHPAATVAPGVQIGAASVVLAGAVVNAEASVGVGVIVNTSTVIEHDTRLEDFTHVSPGAVVCGNSVLGRLGWVGAGATVIPGRKIGSGAIVGAGAVVIRDVATGERVVGNPARPIAGKNDR